MMPTQLRLSPIERAEWLWTGPAGDTSSVVRDSVTVLRELFDVDEVMVRHATWDEWGQPDDGRWERQRVESLDLGLACAVESTAVARLRVVLPQEVCDAGKVLIEDPDHQIRSAVVERGQDVGQQPTAWLVPGVPTGRGFSIAVPEEGRVQLSRSGPVLARLSDAGDALAQPERWVRANRALFDWVDERLREVGFVRVDAD